MLKVSHLVARARELLKTNFRHKPHETSCNTEIPSGDNSNEEPNEKSKPFRNSSFFNIRKKSYKPFPFYNEYKESRKDLIESKNDNENIENNELMGKNEQVDGAMTTCHFEHDKLDNEEKKDTTNTDIVEEANDKDNEDQSKPVDDQNEKVLVSQSQKTTEQVDSIQVSNLE